MIQHPEYFKPNEKLVDIRSHNLVGLCQKCGIPLNNDEITLLKELTTYVEWQGKYPIPLTLDEMWPKKQQDGTWQSRGEALCGRNIQQEVDNLYGKIWDELERIKTQAAI